MSIICHFSDLSVVFNTDPLFTGLEASLSDEVSGLTGPNGSGKSVLLRLLAGQVTPARGEIYRGRPLLYVPQVSRLRGPRVAEALGVGSMHDAFARITSGHGTPDDLGNRSRVVKRRGNASGGRNRKPPERLRDVAGRVRNCAAQAHRAG